jgi:hypothetical protein
MKAHNFNVVSCGCFLAIAVFNLFVGGWSVNYLLLYFAAKTIPLWGAVFIGLFVGEISIPTAVVIALLRLFGVL